MKAHLKPLEIHVILLSSTLPLGSLAVVCNFLLVCRVQPGSTLSTVSSLDSMDTRSQMKAYCNEQK